MLLTNFETIFFIFCHDVINKILMTDSDHKSGWKVCTPGHWLLQNCLIQISDLEKFEVQISVFFPYSTIYMTRFSASWTSRKWLILCIYGCGDLMYKNYPLLERCFCRYQAHDDHRHQDNQLKYYLFSFRISSHILPGFWNCCHFLDNHHIWIFNILQLFCCSTTDVRRPYKDQLSWAACKAL